jgi:hypothetical protein
MAQAAAVLWPLLVPPLQRSHLLEQAPAPVWLPTACLRPPLTFWGCSVAHGRSAKHSGTAEQLHRAAALGGRMHQ